MSDTLFVSGIQENGKNVEDNQLKRGMMPPLIAAVCAVILVAAGIVGWNAYSGAKLAEAKTKSVLRLKCHCLLVIPIMAPNNMNKK